MRIKDKCPAKYFLLPEDPVMVGRSLSLALPEAILYLSPVDLAGQLLDRVGVLVEQVLLEVVGRFHEDVLEAGSDSHLLVELPQLF